MISLVFLNLKRLASAVVLSLASLSLVYFMKGFIWTNVVLSNPVWRIADVGHRLPGVFVGSNGTSSDQEGGRAFLVGFGITHIMQIFKSVVAGLLLDDHAGCGLAGVSALDQVGFITGHVVGAHGHGVSARLDDLLIIGVVAGMAEALTGG